MRKQIGLLILGLFSATTAISVNNDFQQWMQQQQTDYQEYKDKRDKEFTSFLKNNWKEMQLLKGIKRDPKPKPINIPVAKPVPVESPKPTSIEAPKPKPVVLLAPPEPIVKKPIAPAPIVKSPAYKGRKLTITFIGEKITIYYDNKLRTNVPNRINKQAISDTWSKLSKTDYEPLVDQLNTISKQRSLNDWAFAVLINEVSKSINGSPGMRLHF